MIKFTRINVLKPAFRAYLFNGQLPFSNVLWRKKKSYLLNELHTSWRKKVITIGNFISQQRTVFIGSVLVLFVLDGYHLVPITVRKRILCLWPTQQNIVPLTVSCGNPAILHSKNLAEKQNPLGNRLAELQSPIFRKVIIHPPFLPPQNLSVIIYWYVQPIEI